MDFLPINIRIAGANILIVGGGRVATHKAAILSRFTDKATVIAREMSEDMRQLPFRLVERDFEEADLDGGVTLLFVCTGDHELNRKIRRAATARGILTSVCDSPAECDFTSPAIFRDGDLTISVASDSKDVRRSIRVRDRIKEAVSNDIIQID